MPLTLIKETGAGLVDANSYADVADGDAYHAGHLYALAWTAASADQKAVALVMATRLIDAEYQFGGTRSVVTQSLQWPREDCPDPDAGDMVAETMVPKAVVEAACELARELIITDRTAEPELFPAPQSIDLTAWQRASPTNRCYSSNIPV